jgi:hypothetical protein
MVGILRDEPDVAQFNGVEHPHCRQYDHPVLRGPDQNKISHRRWRERALLAIEAFS